jgi:hypothetical protein
LFSASLLALSATMTGAAAQSPSIAPAGPTAPSSLAPPTTPVAPGAAATSPGSPAIQSPIGHRQPRPADLPASVQREEELSPPAKTIATSTTPTTRTKVSNERSGSARGRSAVPAFDVKKSCRATEDAALSLGRSVEACISSEEAAREKLAERWAEFPGQKRTECVGVTRIGGLPSYIEVLTCLELAQDLERIRSSPAETTGFGGGKN